MKKTKVLLKTVLVLGLTVVLLVMSVSAPTFSWFTRPQSQSGGSLEYTLPASKGVVAYDGGDVTMTTYISDDDGVNFSETAVDFTIAENRSRTLQTTSPSNRVYYKTVLRNLSGADQNVPGDVFHPAAGNGKAVRHHAQHEDGAAVVIMFAAEQTTRI